VVTKIGVLGTSIGNGHPFSFSAIINGFDEKAFSESGWPVIQEYLSKVDKGEFGISDLRVTHVWSQDLTMTKLLANSCNIENACSDLNEVLDGVEGLLIARDDWDSHLKLAMPFLERGIPVFIDKPLTLDKSELETLLPFMEKGLLMSCSAFRYATELPQLEDLKSQIGDIRLIACTVLNDLTKYGIHMLEALAGIDPIYSRPDKIRRNNSIFESYILSYENGVEVHLNCIGAVGKTFRVSFFGTIAQRHIDIFDNFTAFKKTLYEFSRMIKLRRSSISAQETKLLIETLILASSLTAGQEIAGPANPKSNTGGN
jgi:hypothetical protein